MALGHNFDGRVTAILGTHTHVPTADQMILVLVPPTKRMLECVGIMTRLLE